MKTIFWFMTMIFVAEVSIIVMVLELIHDRYMNIELWEHYSGSKR